MASPTMLENASGFSAGQISQINAGRYYDQGSTTHKGAYSSNVQINANEYHTHEARRSNGIQELHRNIAAGALHNSAERCGAPQCHEDTRKAVQEDIFSWIADDHEGTNFTQLLWLSGPAGAGKTAIMGTICEKLKEMGSLGAAFFFSSFSGSLDRQSKRRFITTLVYQLQQHPKLEGHISSQIAETIEKDPAIFDKNLKEQLEVLILGPLRQIQPPSESSPSSKSPPMVIAVDGLDECGEAEYRDPHRSRKDDQTEILSLLLHTAKDPAFPFRIIIASRPEHHIRSFMSSTPHVTEIFLDNKYNPDADIRLFLRSKFAELRRRHSHLPSTWPSESDVTTLVENASGQFVYAATVLRFLDHPPKLPQDQLNVVLSIEPSDGTNPFDALDALYTSILRSCPDPNGSVLWLRAYQCIRKKWSSPSNHVPAWFFNRLFESTAGQAQMLLGIPSLMYFAEQGTLQPQPPVGVGAAMYAFYHKTFLEFLDDPERCEGFSHCDPQEWVNQRFEKVIQRGGPEVPLPPSLSGEEKEERTSFFNAYFLHLWDVYFLRVPWGRKVLCVPMGYKHARLESIFDPTGPLSSSVDLTNSPWLALEGLIASHLRRDIFFMVHLHVRKQGWFYLP